MYLPPPPNFLAVVFKKQEILQQVLLLLSETLSTSITPHSADILVDIQPATDTWHACCFLGYTSSGAN